MKVIVLTPIKNEEWIIKHFLTATSKFADAIILLDQMSTDKSREIASSFTKAILIENNHQEFNEDFRQKKLIDTARNLFPNDKRILLALDSDEIICASCLNSLEWNLIKNSEKGTVLYFEKPDLYLTPEKCVRYEYSKYPLGFIDDEKIEHFPSKIHSIRVPVMQDSAKLFLNEIVFLHAAYLRPKVQRAKFRFYSIKENIQKTNPWYRRRRRYRNPKHLLVNPKISETPSNWLNYEDMSLFDITDSDKTWHNFNAVKDIYDYGSIRFWLDDIWDDIDWNSLINSENKPIIYPPKFLQFLMRLFDKYILK